MFAGRCVRLCSSSTSLAGWWSAGARRPLLPARRQPRPAARPSVRSVASDANARSIFALSSAAGKAGVSVIRVSGPRAFAALQELLGVHQSLPVVRVASLRALLDADGETLDQALVLRFAAPRSFTGHDVVELNCHGSVAVVRDLLQRLSQIDGLAPARPGEFTMQAFFNDKLDLTAVEGLADLIGADTTRQRRQALRQLQGELGTLYRGWRSTALNALAFVEALIDFGDDDHIDPAVLDTVARNVDDLLLATSQHLTDPRRGERLRDGVTVCVGGRVNVGKSSLTNLLAQRQVAIVSPHAGTTRDVLETSLDIGGYPALISDTAGLRDSDDDVEQLGIALAHARFDAADVRVHVTDNDDDARAALAQLDRTQRADLVVRNKCDQTPCRLADDDTRLVVVSCATGAGIDGLLTRLTSSMQQIVGDDGGSDPQQRHWPSITRQRHRQQVEEAASALSAARDALTSDIVVCAEELRRAVTALSELTGDAVDVEDVLGVIMSEFCVRAIGCGFFG